MMVSQRRPLSPHLQVYRWQVQSVTSILHRFTGLLLAFGSLLIAASLLALMLGPQHWNCVLATAGSGFGMVFLFAWTWCFAYHLCNGIRHVVQDFAIGFAKPTFIRNSWLSVIGSLIITAVVWGYVLAGGGA